MTLVQAACLRFFREISMAAKSGDSVRVHYTGTLTDGTIFDSSAGGDPLGFKLGEGEVIEGFDTGVMGMQPGETKKVVIAPAQAYGERSDSLVQTVPRDQLNLGAEPEVGMELAMQAPDGTAIPLLITEVTDSTITLDANHPLAGEQLHFEITLVEII
jgi:peptidylprolyl isomerase